MKTEESYWRNIMIRRIYVLSLSCLILLLTMAFSDLVVKDISAQENQTLQSDEFDGQELQSYWEVQNGDQSPYELKDGKLVVQGSFNQNIWRDDTTTGFYQVTDEEKFSVETSLIFDHRDLCSEAGLIIKSPSQNEWVSLKLWGHGVDHGWIMNPNSVYLQLIHRGREIVRIVPDYNPPAGNVPVTLRIDRDGDYYKTWYKPDAQGEWVHVADTTVSLQGPVQVGIYTAICQAEAPGHLTVSYENFIVSSDDMPTVVEDSSDQENMEDIPGPTVTILTPFEGQTFNHGRPTIIGNFSGTAVPILLNLTLNGAVAQAEVSDTGFTYTPHEVLGDGEYTFVAEVTDANGKKAEATVTFTVIVPSDDPDPLPTLQSDTFDGTGQNLQSFWEVQNGDQGPYALSDGKLVVQGSFNQNVWTEDTSTRFYQVTDQSKFSAETSLIFDHRDVCSVAGLIIKSPSQNEWVSLKLWGHGVAHSFVRNQNSVYLQFQHRGREIVQFVPGYNPPAGNVPVALRLDRDGDDYKAWYKPDAQGEWVHIGDTTISLHGPVEVGIYTGICQPEAEGHLSVSFENFIVTPDNVPTDETDKPEQMLIAEDINKDGVVNILDLDLVSANFLQTGENIADVNNDGSVNIADLTLVAAAFGQTSSGAPFIFASIPENLSAEKIEEWLREARRLNLPDAKFKRGILVLEQLLKMVTPKQTALLPNYPNPFNPETWIPYQLANPADVSITIYASDGKLVRKLDIGHQQIGLYQNRSKAAYWDGKNTLSEIVASGVYYYTLTAGDFTATRRMLILK